MKHALMAVLLVTLAACGVDGEPVAPEPKVKPGITLTGKVEVGVKGSL